MRKNYLRWFCCLCCSVFSRSGGGLLFRGLSLSIMGAGAFHGRVRDGIGCRHPARATRSSKPSYFRAWPGERWVVPGLGPGTKVLVCCVLDLSELADFIRPRFSSSDVSSSWAMCRAMEPIGRLGPVSARVTALTHLAYQRDGLSRPSGRPRFEVGFPLRCFQRLSRPYLATRPCRWRDNRFTRGTSIPVLSY